MNAAASLAPRLRALAWGAAVAALPLVDDATTVASAATPSDIETPPHCGPLAAHVAEAPNPTIGPAEGAPPMTQHPDLFAALAAQFEPREVKLRQAPGGRQLHYITARTAMNRLDNVLGPENWWDEFLPMEHSVLCKLTLRLPDGSVLTKCDAGGYAGMADQGDDDKSGYSDAFKRAAAKFGVARYLYRDGVPAFVREGDTDPSAGPDAAPPKPDERRAGAADRHARLRTGKALFAWCKDVEEQQHAGLLRHLANWGKEQGFPTRMLDWNAEQVSFGYLEAVQVLRVTQGARGGRDTSQAH